MIIVWSGFGFVVPITVALTVFFINGLTSSFSQDPRYCSTHYWIAALGILASSVVLRLLIGWLSIDSSPKRLIDPRTNQVHQIARKDHFFFVPLRYWPLVLIGIGSFMLLNDAFQRLVLT